MTRSRVIRRIAAGAAAMVVSLGGFGAVPMWRVQAASAPASALPFPELQGPLNVTADEVVIENTGTGLTARGHVRLTYKAGVATANVLRLRRADRTAELTGNVTFTDPQGKAGGDDITVTFTPANQVSTIVMAGNASAETKDYAIQADRIAADRGAGRLVADRHVTLFMAPDLIVNGDRLAYNQGAHYGIISGHVVASNRAGRVLGDWVELYQKQERATIHGPVTAEVYGATITSSIAHVDFAKSVAVFSGHTFVTRRQGTLTADKVTIYYNTRRFIAEGGTHAHFTDLETSDK
ncbi:MAG TPA: LptA/OstA family protein [bacterium]|nr:LptA/OstA family protein [bacterium]